MSIRVRERVIQPSRVERYITLRMMVFAGVWVRAGNERDPAPGDKGLREPPSLGKVREAVDIIRAQATHWTPFEISEDGVTFRYSLAIDVQPAPDATPVRWIGRDAAGNTVEHIETDGAPARSHAEALAIAESASCDNVVVVHHWFPGDPHATAIARDGTFLRVDWEAHAVLPRACNLARLRYGQIRASGNQTAAHEIGHLMALGHVRAPGAREGGPYLMISRDRLPRRFAQSDALNVHHAVEELGAFEGVVWEGPRHRVSRPRRARRRAYAR